MADIALVTAPDPSPVDLQHLDGMLANLRQAARGAADAVVYMAEARDRLAAASDDPEARHAVRMASLRMRGDAYALAQSLAALAQPDGATP